MATDGRILYPLSLALLDAFTADRFDEMLFFRLDKVRERISSNRNDYETVVYHVIRTADAEGWLDRLVMAARASRPSHPELFAFAQSRRLAPSTAALESILSARELEIDPVRFRAALGRIEGQVCRVETQRGSGVRPLGTGFLVGPDLCLTSYHVVRDLYVGRLRPDEIGLRFDYKFTVSGGEPFPGTLFGLAADYSAAFAPNAAFEADPNQPDGVPSPNELDFAVIRVDGAPGKRPIGKLAEPGAELRGWVERPTRQPDANEQIVVLQHLMGRPMRLAFGRVIGLNANATRIHHTADTDEGSSGSPCFTLDLRLTAVHQAGDPVRDAWRAPAYNTAVPAAKVFQQLCTGES
jgi:hypothetical protein